MENKALPEVWLRGPVEGIPALLQPAAHALLQATEDVSGALSAFPPGKLWERPGEMASVGFHLKHVPGVLDRLCTYAAGRQLAHEQLKYLSEEELANDGDTTELLLLNWKQEVDKAIERLRRTDSNTLTEVRYVGRKKLPSTVLGLLFHAAEHTMRHTGQLMVTAKILNPPG